MKTKFLLYTLLGILAFTSCEKDEDDPTPQPSTTNNNGGSGNGGSGNGGGSGNSNEMPASLQNMTANQIIVTDTATGKDTVHSFSRFRVIKSSFTFYQLPNIFSTQDRISIDITPDSTEGFIPPANRTFDYRIDTRAVLPAVGRWQMGFCPANRIPGYVQDCYATGYDRFFTRVTSTGTLYYKKEGDKITVAFENYNILNKLIRAKFEFTDATVAASNYDGTEVMGTM